MTRSYACRGCVSGADGCDDLIKWRGYSCDIHFCAGCPLQGFCDRSCSIGCATSTSYAQTSNGTRAVADLAAGHDCVLGPMPVCSYWDASILGLGGGVGVWRQDGVVLNSTPEELLCAFNHLTDFAAQLGPPRQTVRACGVPTLRQTFPVL
jgi:hypothetical protein